MDQYGKSLPRYKNSTLPIAVTHANALVNFTNEYGNDVEKEIASLIFAITEEQHKELLKNKICKFEFE